MCQTLVLRVFLILCRQALHKAGPSRLFGSVTQACVSATSASNPPDPVYLCMHLCLSSLTSSGGPQYHSKAVREAAMHALDCLFPLGKRSRQFVRFFFRYILAQGASVYMNAINTPITRGPALLSFGTLSLCRQSGASHATRCGC